MTECETRRIDRHRAESDLGPDKRLSGLDFTAAPSVSKAQAMALAEGHEGLDRGANVLLFGAPAGHGRPPALRHGGTPRCAAR